MKNPPSWLQPTLWSIKTDRLDLEEDKVYIINQILVYGGLRELRWLFKTYPKKVIQQVFLHQPLKIYPRRTLNFVKEILLGLGNKKLDLTQYDRNLPRTVRR